MYRFDFGYTGQYPINALRIDSTKMVGTDSLFYPNVNLLQKGSYYRIDGSWIGKRVVVKTNGDNFIINSDNDSILIKTQSALKDSWTVYQKNSVMQITAEVTEIKKMSFLDLEDSVKTITFHVYDASMKPMPNQFDGAQIKISKNFGLIESLPFYAFPNVISDNQVLHCSLSGMTNPKVGVQNLTAEDVFDFQVGDEYHIIEAYGAKYGGVDIDSLLTIERVLERRNFTNQLSYIIDKTERHYHKYWITKVATNLVKRDTVTMSINSLRDMFLILPGEFKGISVHHEIQTVSMELPSNKLFRMGSFVSSDSINWSEIELANDVVCSDDKYIKGLGGPYYNCFGSSIYKNRNLFYSKKSGVEFGTKLVILSIPSVYKENSIRVSSIIGRKELTANIASSELPARLEVVSVSGTVVFSKSIDAESSTISLQSFPAGAYLYRVRGERGSLVTGKIMLR
jgi:hypothetical protein